MKGELFYKLLQKGSMSVRFFAFSLAICIWLSTYDFEIKKIIYLLVCAGSLWNDCNKWGWGGLKPGARKVHLELTCEWHGHNHLLDYHLLLCHGSYHGTRLEADFAQALWYGILITSQVKTSPIVSQCWPNKWFSFGFVKKEVSCINFPFGFCWVCSLMFLFFRFLKCLLQKIFAQVHYG